MIRKRYCLKLEQDLMDSTLSKKQEAVFECNHISVKLVITLFIPKYVTLCRIL